MMTQKDLATTFHRLHGGPPLILANAWDAGSARLIEAVGAAAIATTSAGVSWALGRRDGEGMDRSQVVGVVRGIVEAVQVPVSADIESGYGEGSPADVAQTVTEVLGAGAVGINLEDAPGPEGAVLLPPEQQGDRIRAAREAARVFGVNLFINARTDVFLREVGEPEERLLTVLRRAAHYVDAGADGIFVPGVADPETIGSLAAEISVPLNVMAGPGSPSVQELATLGVARVSLGPALALGAFAAVRRGAEDAFRNGTYGPLEGALAYGEVDGLFGDP